MTSLHAVSFVFTGTVGVHKPQIQSQEEELQELRNRHSYSVQGS